MKARGTMTRGQASQALAAVATLVPAPKPLINAYRAQLMNHLVTGRKPSEASLPQAYANVKVAHAAAQLRASSDTVAAHNGSAAAATAEKVDDVMHAGEGVTSLAATSACYKAISTFGELCTCLVPATSRRCFRLRGSSGRVISPSHLRCCQPAAVWSFITWVWGYISPSSGLALSALMSSSLRDSFVT